MDKNENINNQNNTDKTILKFNNTVFRDIDEFIMDMKNIFTQMIKTYQGFIEATKTYTDKKDLEELKISLNNKLSQFQEELKKRLDYITDTNQVDLFVVDDKRPKLMQLKALNNSLDITKNTLETMGSLADFYNNRILANNIVTRKGIISQKKDN